MNINKVTITGADDKINQNDLFDLSIKYPFVEWAILFSIAKEGELRYPSQEWIKTLVSNFKLDFSAHFCGWYSKQILEEQNFDLITNLHPNFKRVQLNYSFKHSKGWDLMGIIDYCNKYDDRSIILQYNKSNSDTLDPIIYTDLPSNLHFLYDSSGGRGTEITSINKPINTYYTGYAGGLNLNNIDSICKLINNFQSNALVWVDLESGARINNEFDLKTVEDILNKCKPFIV